LVPCLTQMRMATTVRMRRPSPSRSARTHLPSRCWMSRRRARPVRSVAEGSRRIKPGSRSPTSLSGWSDWEPPAALWPARGFAFLRRVPFCRILRTTVRLAASSCPIMPARRASATILRTAESGRYSRGRERLHPCPSLQQQRPGERVGWHRIGIGRDGNGLAVTLRINIAA
jgi:hypothetical protein